MNYLPSAQEETFRTELHAWLVGNIPATWPDGNDEESVVAALRQWHRSLAAGGWVGLSLPVEVGGRGLLPLYEGIFNEEIALTGAPPAPRNVNFLARSLLGFGSPDQRERFLRPLLACEELWCQGFSEPGAGSDLASLRTRAELDGDEYVVNGQKVWTTFGKWADWCLLLARTDPDLAKHKGISALALRMDSPGVTVRPLRQINRSEELSEIFFDDVRVPASQLIGAPGDGWRLAMKTLAYERGPADVGAVARNGRLLREMQEALGRDPNPPSAIARRLARVAVHMEILRLHVLRSLSARARQEPGPEGSVDKLLMADVEQELARLHLDILGPAALVGADESGPLGNYLHSRAMTIYGGSAQIQRNIIAQRVLGMPTHHGGR
jgi:alkylation response protein AidB-like acyl-CoA dehydrogenase